MDQAEIDTGSPKEKGKHDHLIPEVFVHDPEQAERTERVIDQVLEIERARFPEDQAYERETFEEAFKNTAPTRENAGRTTTAVLVRDPKDDSIFGFTYAEPGEGAYYDAEDPDDAFHPERLKDPDLPETAYIVDTVFRESKSGVLKRTMDALEAELYKKGYHFVHRDSLLKNDFAENLLRNNADRILETNVHDSEYGPQRFMKMRINPPATTVPS